MNTARTSLRSLERIAGSHGMGTLIVGIILVVWLGGHGALHSAHRDTSSRAPAVVEEAY